MDTILGSRAMAISLSCRAYIVPHGNGRAAGVLAAVGLLHRSVPPASLSEFGRHCQLDLPGQNPTSFRND